MGVYFCPICEAIAFEKWNQLRAHFMGAHREEKDNWPADRADTEVEVEALPEGVKLSKAPKRKVVIEEEESPATGVSPGELSSDGKHLHDLLLLHGVKQATTDTIVNLYDKLDLYKDPRNLANLLKQRLDRREQYAIVPVLFELFPERKDELPYIIPPSEGGAPWMSQQPGYSFYPKPGGSPGGYPGSPYQPGYGEPRSGIDKYIEWQMAKEMKDEKGEKSGVSSETDSRIGRIEAVVEKLLEEKSSEIKESKAVSAVKGEITELKSILNKMSEEKEKDKLIQPLLEKIELTEKLHRDEMARMRDDLKSKKEGSDEESYLQRYMQERDKRHDEELARYREDLKGLTAELIKSRDKEGSAYKQALQDFTTDKEKFEQMREKARAELKGEGWSGREKDFEERILDIVEKQAAPAIIGEVKETRRTLQDIAKKLGGAESQSREAETTPISVNEAETLSEVMSIEEKMKELASS